jgi:hypothetical protein
MNQPLLQTFRKPVNTEIILFMEKRYTAFFQEACTAAKITKII